MALLRSVCVFCGARSGSNPAHLRTAHDTGTMIAAAGWRLVYGAGDVGLMGEVARAATLAGAPTLGVIPAHLMGAERLQDTGANLVITQTMHERKKVMFMNADAIVLLPGGAGSLDEFFEVLTWAQIGLHQKPVVIVNADGYWGPLIGLLDHIVDQGFAGPTLHDLYVAVPDVPALKATLDRMLG